MVSMCISLELRILHTVLRCVCVPSCEVPVLFSPCIPGGLPLIHSSSSYPDPQPSEAQTPQAAVSGVGGPQATAQQALACWVSAPQGAGHLLGCGAGVSSPRDCVRHLSRGATLRGRTGRIQAGCRGSPGPPPALAAAGCLVAEVRT